MARTKNPTAGTMVTTTTTTTDTKTAPRRTTKATTASTATAVGPSKKSTIVVSAEERHRMIAEAAYLRAERRGFANGDPKADWFAAEQEVDALIATWKRNGGRPVARA